MSEAIQIIKRDLGPDAIIINSRKIRQPGWRGLLGYKKWEVTAALDKVEPLENQDFTKTIRMKKDMDRESDQMKDILRQTFYKKELDPLPYDKVVPKWQRILTDMEIKKELIDQLLQEVRSDLDVSENNKIVQSFILKLSSLLAPLYQDASKKKILVFIGPTGVGKTTTLAKLAAQFSINNQKKIGIITIDTYRIGAVEQLKTYGEIMSLPVEVVMTPQELQEAVIKMSDKDMILIDATGRSYKDTAQIHELKEFVDKVPESEIFLVLSSTTKEKDLYKNIESYNSMKFSRLIFTKIDETDVLGNILNITLDIKIPIAYITDGQNVADDIDIMYPDKLARLIFRGVDLSERPSC